MPTYTFHYKVKGRQAFVPHAKQVVFKVSSWGKLIATEAMFLHLCVYISCVMGVWKEVRSVCSYWFNFNSQIISKNI